jgi:NAD(P)H-dependent nitrite reductase small subunit
MKAVKVATVDDIPEGTAMMVQANGKDIALFHINGEFYAIDNLCPHQGGSLSEGFIEGSKVTCPFHSWQFDVTSGQGIMPPSEGVKSYPVDIQGNDIYVEV